MAAPPQPFIDDILLEIFLRVPCPAALARASTACVSFHRVINEPYLARRFRSLHQPPPVVGVLGMDNIFHAAEPPHPSAPTARAVANAADFSFSFLPDGYWRCLDVRYSRVLLYRVPKVCNYHVSIFMELVVCDPLFRSFVRLPPIPDHLVASFQQEELFLHFDPFLAPVRGAEEENETSFRVIWTAQGKAKLVAYVFSSSTREWHQELFDNWRVSAMGMGMSSGRGWLPYRQYAHGCFYWKVYMRDELLVLDARLMRFSTIGFPPAGPTMEQSAIVEAEDGRPGMFTLHYHSEFAPPDLHYTIWRNNGEGVNQWQLERIIQLPPEYHYWIVGTAGEYLLVQGVPLGTRDVQYFSVEVKTLQLQTFCEVKHSVIDGFLYAGFPPFLSRPSV